MFIGCSEIEIFSKPTASTLVEPGLCRKRHTQDLSRHYRQRYFFPAAFIASAITALKACFGSSFPSKSNGLPWARQETASFAPQNVTTFTESRCLRNARKIPA